MLEKHFEMSPTPVNDFSVPSPFSNDEFLAWGDEDPCLNGNDSFYSLIVSLNLKTESVLSTMEDLTSAQEVFSTPKRFDVGSPPRTNMWQRKLLEHWTSSDIIDWLSALAEANDIDITKFSLENFNCLTGRNLVSMREDDILSLDPMYGHYIFSKLGDVILRNNDPSFAEKLPSFETLQSPCESSLLLEQEQGDSLALRAWSELEYLGVNAYEYPQPDSSTEGDEHIHEVKCESLPKLKKTGRGPGRPPKKDKLKKKSEKKLGKLWEFIRDLLKNPDYSPSLIRWENHQEGVFRFVQSEKVAQLWGDAKGNTRMTYEKLSRAMRYYYKGQVLLPVIGRRLVYKFGPQAKDWRPQEGCPNFYLNPHASHNNRLPSKL